MNPIIEELKSEDGRYKVKKLSDFKIQLEYKIPVFGAQEGSIRLIDTLNVKVRYQIDKNQRRHQNELPIYYLIPFKDKFMQIVSQNWKIKKKSIHLQRKGGMMSIDGHLIYGLYTGFIFDDKSWTRDYFLNKILNEKRDDS